MEEKDQKISDIETKLEQLQKEKELDNIFWKQECDSLQKALTEKEKEIEQLKKFDDLNKTLFDLFRTAFKKPNKVDDLFNTLKTMQEKQDQDKISFAVEQLEKVYEYTADVWWVDGVSEAVCNFIDQQIKELKEKK